MKKSRLLFKITISVLAAVLGIGFLMYSKEVGEGIKNGLVISAGVLIPSLFSFMVLSGFIINTDLGYYLSLPLYPVTKYLFKLERSLGAVVLMSMVGGYPVGAKMIAELLMQDRISKKTAERMLAFCVNAGPSFIITAVGTGMLLNRKAGIILLLIHLSATLIVGTLMSLPYKREEVPLAASKELGISSAFVAAVTKASSSMITFCSFAVLFSGIIALIDKINIAGYLGLLLNTDTLLIRTVLAGIIEVTSGCISSVKLHGPLSIVLLSSFLSFGGISVIFQIMSCFKDCNISFRKYIISRILHIIVSGSISYMVYDKYFKTVDALMLENQPYIISNGKTLIISACLISMCTIMLLSVKKE